LLKIYEDKGYAVLHKPHAKKMWGSGGVAFILCLLYLQGKCFIAVE